MRPEMWHFAAAALHLAALALLIHALRGKAGGHGRRCPRCGYDMAGAQTLPDTNLRCPECGREAPANDWTHERCRWRHRRKHWRLAGVAVFLQLVAGYHWYRLLPGRQGWIGLIPTTVLVYLVDDPMKQEPLAATLRQRLGAGHYWRWQASVVVEHERQLWTQQVDPAKLLLTRTRWPAGQPVVVTLSGMGLHLSSFAGVSVASPDDTASLSFDPPGIMASYYGPRPPTQLSLPPPDFGPNEYLVDLVIGWDDWNGNRWTYPVKVPVHVEGVATIADAMPARSDPAFDAHLRSRVSLNPFIDLELWNLGIDRGALLRVYTDDPANLWQAWPLPRSCSFAATLTIERLDPPALLAELTMSDEQWSSGGASIGIAPEQWTDLVDPQTGRIRVENVAIRVRPDPVAALANVEATERWEGRVELRGDQIRVVMPER